MNLCKGSELAQLLQLQRSCPVLYVGDGKGDCCPCLRLGSSCVALARKGYPLAGALREAGFAGRILEWESWAQLRELVRAELGL